MKIWTFTIIVFPAIWILPVLTAAGQPGSGTGLQPLRPIVPDARPRPLESDAERFPDRARGPLAGFLEQVTVSDAIIEVVVDHGRILTLKEPIAREGGIALIATGDPTVLDFDVAGPRLLRILGSRVGATDLSVTTDAGETYTFEIHVVYDLELAKAYLQQIFPEALINLKQLREHVVLEGQARSTEQVSQIYQTLQAYLSSLQVAKRVSSRSGRRPVRPEDGTPEDEAPDEEPPPDEEGGDGEPPAGPAPIDVPEGRPRTRGQFRGPQIINLMRVPGVQQVMLKVQIAELDRTALRQIGADIFFDDGTTALATSPPVDFEDLILGTGTTIFGIFNTDKLAIFLQALRSNAVATILAEPNLVAMNGHEASFIAGGEFPYTVPQTGSGGGAFVFTVEFKKFGVQLDFVPTILDDETIRLRVSPEVSDIDRTTLVAIGAESLVPAIRTRQVSTTVELKQGQTLALAGLLQVELEADTQRIPGLGDLPYIGPMFSNTTHKRVERELLVMVTPHLVSPMEPCEVPPAPGSEVLDPNDCEFYFLNRIEGRTGRPFRSTTAWDDPHHLVHKLKLEQRHICGPVGYSE